MLFLLDHNVDAAVCRMLHSAGHDCTSVGAAGLATGSDDAISVFGQEISAIVLTHDREFIARRRKNTFGKHVLLACQDWEAADILKENLAEVLAMSVTRQDITMRLSKHGLIPYPTKWQ